MVLQAYRVGRCRPLIVVADTTPLNYLVLIHQADLLPRLFGRVLIAPAVYEELQDSETPDPVQSWLADALTWLQVQPLRLQPDPRLDYLDAGEREAIALAEERKADQILFDEMNAPGSNAPSITVHWHARHFAQSRATRSA